MELILENIINKVVKTVIEEGKHNGFIFEEREELYPLNTWNGYVILKHDSSKKIKNGVINRNFGRTNNYSNRSDIGNYFWGSQKIGKDNSNIHRSTYYCLVPIEEVYDMMRNPKNYSDMREAVKHENYVAINWPSTEGAVVVVSCISTPISYISYNKESNYENEISGLYDADWNLFKSYELTYDGKKLKSILKKLKLTKDIQLPDFINDMHGYTYEEILDFYQKNKKLYNW